MTRYLKSILCFVCVLSVSSFTIPEYSETYLYLILENANIDPECSYQIKTVHNKFSERAEWAMKMIDASAKLQSGVLYGNIMHVGNYKECLSVHQNVNNRVISGKYCSALFEVSSNASDLDVIAITAENTGQTNKTEKSFLESLRMSWGICVPAACSVKDLQQLSDTAEIVSKNNLHFTFVEDLCDHKDKPVTFSGMTIFAIIFFFVVTCLVAGSTVYDIFKTKMQKGKRKQLFIAFSLYTNGSRLLSTKTSEVNLGCLNGIRVISMCWILIAHRFIYILFLPTINATEFFEFILKLDSQVYLTQYTNGSKLFSTKTNEVNLGCLNGLRVISMCWILIAHRFMYSFFFPTINAIQIFEWKTKIENTVVLSANMAVDTFFTVSGLLIVYVFLLAKENNRKITLPMFYIHRYLRLTPALAVVVLFYGTLLQHIGSGPFWAVVYYVLQESCEKNWWSTLLYVQNYVHPNDQCVAQGWYLAVDTQLYFLSPLLLFPIIRWPKKTIAAIIALMLASASAAFGITWKNKYGSVYFDQNPGQFKDIYAPTHIRVTPWLIGFIAGYILFTSRKNRVAVGKLLIFCLWIVSLGLLLCIVLGAKGFMEGDYDIVESSMFNAFARIAWAIALCLIVFLCVNGYGGWVNQFLSAKVFTVLIRINYSMYLLHQIVLAYMVVQKQSPEYFSNMHTLHSFWGDFVYTVILSTLFTLVFESPILAIEKLAFGKSENKREVVEEKYANHAENGTCNTYTINAK